MAVTIPHNRLTYGEAECDSVVAAVRSGRWAQGPRVRQLEEALARVAKVKEAVCVGSGLAALRLALGALGVQPADTVLVPAYSCVALANASLAWGAKPVVVDVEGETWNMKPEACVSAIAQFAPRAVIVVNTFGVPASLAQLAAAGVPIIEDCAHAFGIESEGQALGGRANLGVLSFHATKLLGGGEGGAVLTNSAAIADFVRATRDYDDQPPSAVLLNDKMSDIEAALVFAQLQRLPSMLAARETLAQRYCLLLSPASQRLAFKLPPSADGRVWYRFAIEMLRTPAAKIVAALQPHGVEAALPVTDWRPLGSPPCPTSDLAYRSIVSLPLYPTLTEPEQDHVVRSFLAVCEEAQRA